jgi:hypothetical protein
VTRGLSATGSPVGEVAVDDALHRLADVGRILDQVEEVLACE